MEPWPHAWMIAVGLGLLVLAALFVWSSLRRQSQARSWAVTTENDRRAIRAAQEWPESKQFAVTVDEEGLVVRIEPMEPIEGHGWISFAPDLTSRFEVVVRDD